MSRGTRDITQDLAETTHPGKNFIEVGNHRMNPAVITEIPLIP